MTRTNHMWRAVALSGVAALALAACSSSSSAGGDKAADAGKAAPMAKADGQLVIGELLPQTGSLAFLGPPEFAGVDLAVKQINEAGGVLGKDVVVVPGDSGDTTSAIASTTVDTLFAKNSDVVLGAASSGVTLSVLDKVTGSGHLMISPANTSPELSSDKDKGLYFRTAPSDVLQGRVLGDLMLEDGHQNISIMALQDSYGTGLAENVTKAVEAGGGKIVDTVVYQPDAASFSADVAKAIANKPDALALIAFEETKKIVPELVKAGVDMKSVYFVDGNLSQYGDAFEAGTLEGVKGTLPGAAASDAFKELLKSVDPKLEEFAYSAESYDATMLVALATIAADTDDMQKVAQEMINVSKGGEKCTEFKACADLLAAGKDIDFDGVSGPIEFQDNGDPGKASIGIYQYGADNKYTFVKGFEGTL